MGILKVVNRKDSSRAAMLDAIAYCNNPAKVTKQGNRVCGICNDFVKAFTVNKFLNHQEHRDRQFKSCIISMEAQWPEESTDRAGYETLMQQLQTAATNFLFCKGYQTQSPKVST